MVEWMNEWINEKWNEMENENKYNLEKKENLREKKPIHRCR